MIVRFLNGARSAVVSISNAERQAASFSFEKLGRRLEKVIMTHVGAIPTFNVEMTGDEQLLVSW